MRRRVSDVRLRNAACTAEACVSSHLVIRAPRVHPQSSQTSCHRALKRATWPHNSAYIITGQTRPVNNGTLQQIFSLEMQNEKFIGQILIFRLFIFRSHFNYEENHYFMINREQISLLTIVNSNVRKSNFLVIIVPYLLLSADNY